MDAVISGNKKSRQQQQQQQRNQEQELQQLNHTQRQQHRRQQEQPKPIPPYPAAMTIKVEDCGQHPAPAVAPVALLPGRVGTSATTGRGVFAGTSESSLERGARVQQLPEQHTIHTAAAAAPLGPADSAGGTDVAAGPAAAAAAARASAVSALAQKSLGAVVEQQQRIHGPAPLGPAALALVK